LDKRYSNLQSFPTRRSSDLYSEEMETFLALNPGLESRFPFILNFRDFTIDQLLKIAKQMVAEREYELVPEAEWKLRTHLLKFRRSEEHTSELQSRFDLVCRL